jgi:hypothetical protein
MGIHEGIPGKPAGQALPTVHNAQDKRQYFPQFRFANKSSGCLQVTGRSGRFRQIHWAQWLARGENRWQYPIEASNKMRKRAMKSIGKYMLKQWDAE